MHLPVVLLLTAALTGCGLKADVRPVALEQARVAEATTPAAPPAATPGAAPSTAAPPTPSPVPVAPGTPSRAPAATRSAVPTPTPSPVPRTGLALVGRWHVDGVGVAPGTALVLGEQLAVFLPCGVLDGDWRADGEQGLFVASSDSGDSSCFPPGGRAPLDWLEGAERFDVEGEQRVLRARDGRVLARLRPGARPTTGPDRSSVFAEEPEVTPRLRAELAGAAPLPRGVRPVTQQALQRRWRPDVPNERVHVAFGSDGAYSGSDGCNGQGGRYVLGQDGRLLGTSGPSTAIGCDGADAPGWVAGAGRAGLDGDELALYDDAGALLGRLRPV